MTEDFPVVSTTHGAIKGIKRTSVYDEVYVGFERIPYAKPPLGDLRFKAPQPPEPWSGVLNCTESTEKPLQKNPFTHEIEGQEDCLYLNVYVKKLHSEKPLPVMIYIYGGSFQHGSSTRQLLAPDYFMQEDVILVTMNYRLDSLGFLCLSDPDINVPGNAALKDQLAAVRWFKQNVINFNGDPDNITLFGESAGGAAAHYLALSDKSKGLFHKAILMSGTAHNKWANIAKGDYAYRLAKVNGYTGENIDKEVYEYLLQLEGADLIRHDLRTNEENLNDIPFIFGPTIEPFDTTDGIICADPEEMLQTSWSNEIPMLIGGTSFEGLLRYPRVKKNPEIIDIVNRRPELLVPVEVRAKKTPIENHKLGQDILQLHTGGTEITEDKLFSYLDITSYKILWLGFHRTVLSRLRKGAAATYLYRFDYDSPTFNQCRLKYCGPDVRGVAHADDLSYLFFNNMAWKLPTDSEEYKTIRTMVGIWTTFAKSSNPNGEHLQGTQWEPVEEDQPYKCLNISTTVEPMRLPEADKLKFWHSLYDN